MKARLYSPLLIIVGFACASAQTVAPELAQLMVKYKADLGALDTQRQATLKEAQLSYAGTLAAAEKTATATRNAAALAAIATERAALDSGLMAPVFPAGLPRELQMPRKTYLDTSTRIRAAEAPRRQAIDTDYLRALTNLQAKAENNSELLKQVAVEKQKLMANAPPIAAEAIGSSGSIKQNNRNAVINGTFDLTEAGDRPSGWNLKGNAEEACKVVRDGSNNTLRISTGTIVYTEVAQEIPVPPKAKSVILSGRVRGKWENRDTTHDDWGANIYAVNVDTDGKPIGDWIGLVGGRDVGWKSLSQTGRIPTGSKTLRVQCVLKFISGAFQFDDIVVEFR
jgi:hypothetical protein